MTFPILSVAVVLVVAAFVFLFSRLASRLDSEATSPEWLQDFSLDSYAPMGRLLAQGDFEFLRNQPGYNPQIEKRLRVDRRAAFLGYLELMVADFNQLLRMGRLFLVCSKVDRPEFGRELWRQQFKFYFTVYSIRFKLALAPLGLRADGNELLNSLGNVLQQVQQLAALTA